MPLIRTEESDIFDNIKKRDLERYQGLVKEYPYVFSPAGSGLEGFPEIQFHGLIPGDEYLGKLRDCMSRLEITGPLSVCIEPQPFYAEMFAEMHPYYHRAKKAGLSKEKMEEFKEGLERLSENTGGFFSANSEPLMVVLNCDAPNRDEAMLEEFLHILVARQGWLKPLEKATLDANSSLLPQHNYQGDVLFTTQSGIIDWMSCALAVEKGFKDFYESGAHAYLDRVLELPGRPGPHASFMEALRLVHKTTPPPNLPDGKMLLDSMKEKRDLLVGRLYEEVQALVPKLYQYFSRLELPPKQDNLFLCIGQVFNDYLSLPHDKMEYAGKLDKGTTLFLPWNLGKI